MEIEVFLPILSFSCEWAFINKQHFKLKTEVWYIFCFQYFLFVIHKTFLRNIILLGNIFKFHEDGILDCCINLIITTLFFFSMGIDNVHGLYLYVYFPHYIVKYLKLFPKTPSWPLSSKVMHCIWLLGLVNESTSWRPGMRRATSPRRSTGRRINPFFLCIDSCFDRIKP